VKSHPPQGLNVMNPPVEGQDFGWQSKGEKVRTQISLKNTSQAGRRLRGSAVGDKDGREDWAHLCSGGQRSQGGILLALKNGGEHRAFQGHQ